MTPEVGDIWRWTKNSHEFPHSPEYNYFLVLDKTVGVRVLYLFDGRMVLYHESSFSLNTENLVKVA